MLNIEQQTIDKLFRDLTRIYSTSATSLIGLVSIKTAIEELTCDDVYDAANHITKKDLSLIWNNTVKIKKTSPQIILKLTKTIISKGYPIHNILYSLIKRVIFSPDLSDCAKSKLSLCLSESEKYIIEGGDEFLQLLNIFSKLVQYSKI